MMPFIVRCLSRITAPNTPAKIGPIRGETSIEATRMTLEFSTRPTKAMMLARSSSSKKSKVNMAPSRIRVTISAIMFLYFSEQLFYIALFIVGVKECKVYFFRKFVLISYKMKIFLYNVHDNLYGSYNYNTSFTFLILTLFFLSIYIFECP